MKVQGCVTITFYQGVFATRLIFPFLYFSRDHNTDISCSKIFRIAY